MKAHNRQQMGAPMRLTVVISALLVVGCAGVTVKPINSIDNPDSTANGIRYYEAAPFLLVYPDGKGGLVSELKFLPDTTTKRSIDPFAVLAQNETTLTFTNGYLSQSKAVIDETVVPKAIVTALEKVATAAMNAAADDPNGFREEDLPLPQLYRIVITDRDVSLMGNGAVNADGVPVGTIRATIAQPGAKGAADDPAGKNDVNDEDKEDTK